MGYERVTRLGDSAPAHRHSSRNRPFRTFSFARDFAFHRPAVWSRARSAWRAREFASRLESEWQARPEHGPPPEPESSRRDGSRAGSRASCHRGTDGGELSKAGFHRSWI